MMTITFEAEELITVTTSLTELIAEMHEADFPLRVGAPKEEVKRLRDRLFQIGEDAGLNMRP